MNLVQPALVRYTFGMKTAVSLPDELFERADRYARQTGKSRSQVFREALLEYLARHPSDAIVDMMNAVVQELGDATNSTDAFAATAAQHILENVEW